MELNKQSRNSMEVGKDMNNERILIVNWLISCDLGNYREQRDIRSVNKYSNVSNSNN